MATNIVIRPKRNESAERLIKRFIRKCKKEKIVETYRAKTDYFIKRSVRKKLKRKKAIREQQKLQRKRDVKLFR